MTQTLQVITMTPEEMQTKWREGDISVYEISNAPEFKTKTALNFRNGVGTENTNVLATIPTEMVVKTAVITTPESVKNVGATEKGLWLMVKYQNQNGFVRAKEEYLLPWYQTAQPNSFDYASLPFLQSLTRDKKLTEAQSKDFYETGIVPLCDNRELFKKAINEGYIEVPSAQYAPCATTTSAVLEAAFRLTEMSEQAALFNNHANFMPTHSVEMMLYRLGFNYWLKKDFKSQKGAIGLLAGRATSHGVRKHSFHIYTIFSEIDKKFDLIGDNGGYNHEYRGEGYGAGTEGFWLPSSITPQQR